VFRETERLVAEHALRGVNWTRTGIAEAQLVVAARRLQGTLEWLDGHPDRARTWWQRSLHGAEEVGARYDMAMTNLEIGRRTGVVERLDRAEALFAELGSSFDIEQTRLARATALIGIGSASR